METGDILLEAELCKALRYCRDRAQAMLDGRPTIGGPWSPEYMLQMAREIHDAAQAALQSTIGDE